MKRPDFFKSFCPIFCCLSLESILEDILGFYKDRMLQKEDSADEEAVVSCAFAELQEVI